MTTLPFHYPWNRTGINAPQDNRPYAEVMLHYSGQTARVWCLVDSGADHTQVNSGFGKKLGIKYSSKKTTITTATGGQASLNEVTNMSMDIEGIRVTGKCFFGNNSIDILGRITFLNTFAELGFDTNGWMHN
jgi:predicted aspartyl protease